ncbi:MAG: hypothetical protein OXD43_12030 [Bacteroidetes bacterium]|nr:hypothetical protein [Bacteroidota bacterium]
MTKKDTAVLRAMEGVAKAIGYIIRWDSGPFRGGRCTLGGRELIILNRLHPTEVHLGVLARILRDAPLAEISMRKAMRKRVESVIRQHSSE